VDEDSGQATPLLSKGFVDDTWPDHLPSGNQKRFWRNPVKVIGAVVRPAPVVLALHALFKSRAPT
jgi:hypothetical protein